MLFAENNARAAGLRELLRCTNELMAENLQFYKRLGYQEVGRHMQAGSGRVFMRKVIASSPPANANANS
jgi:hypothetical protein